MSDSSDKKKMIPIAIGAILVVGLLAWLFLDAGDTAPGPVRPVAAGDRTPLEKSPPVETPRETAPVAAPDGPAPAPAKGPTPPPKRDDGLVHMTAQPLRPMPTPEEVLTSSNQPREERAVELRWLIGDAWTVDVYFREMQKPEGGWSSAPTQFRYRVTDETVFEGIECFEVKVDIPAQPDFREEVFYVDRSRYTLVGLFRQSREQGKWVKRTHKFERGEEGGASSARYTSVPFDLPGVDTIGKVGAASDPFTAFRFSEPGAPRPDPATLVGADGSLVEVSFSSENGKVLQRWSVDDPRWPVESITSKARSFRTGG